MPSVSERMVSNAHQKQNKAKTRRNSSDSAGSTEEPIIHTNPFDGETAAAQVAKVAGDLPPAEISHKALMEQSHQESKNHLAGQPPPFPPAANVKPRAGTNPQNWHRTTMKQ